MNGGQGMGRHTGGYAPGNCLVHNSRGSRVKRLTGLQDIQQDIEVKQNHRLCFSRRESWYSATASMSAGIKPVIRLTSVLGE